MAEPNPYERLFAASFAWWRLALTVGETMVAAHSVIGARGAMMGRAGFPPYRVPHREMERMTSEKLRAFGKAHSGAAKAFGPAMPAAMLMGATAQDSLAMLDLGERTLAAWAAWWQPLHAGATANARRLARR